jgi:hypothetical protein
MFSEEDLICSYSREDAINDGVLVDVSEIAREEGFRFPVAVTSAVFNRYLDPTPEQVKMGQSFNARLQDLCMMLSMKIRASSKKDSIMNFVTCFTLDKDVKLTPNENHIGADIREAKLKSIVSAGDNREPVITIMLPTED